MIRAFGQVCRCLLGRLVLCGLVLTGPAAADSSWLPVDREIAAHPGRTGVRVLDTGEDALLARAWLADRAEHTIEVQYFIWSTDNIGTLAAEALLRAAERGVKVRVIVDDLLIDAPDQTLLALAKHPNVEIRIYNPKHKVGTPLHARVLNTVVDFRGVNQRMHNKTFMVDGKVAITGGRNMAAEYFDYNREYNFRDRDILLLGVAVKAMQDSFERFWTSGLAVPVEQLYDGLGLMQKHVTVDATEIQNIYGELHGYARSPENFSPEVHAAIADAAAGFPAQLRTMAWDDVQFISDQPGKNSRVISLGGGGQTGEALAKLVAGAKRSILIQSPYLVLTRQARDLFKQALARGVRIRIHTNSLASTDNLPAFSGYRNQRAALLAMGVEIHECKPHPAIAARQMASAMQADSTPPIRSLHAKTLVVDSEAVFIGTYNLDPRSQNLNTEAGVIVHDDGLAQQVEQAIEADMRPENSWNAATDDPDNFSSAAKRSQVLLWQMTPIRPVL